MHTYGIYYLIEDDVGVCKNLMRGKLTDLACDDAQFYTLLGIIPSVIQGEGSFRSTRAHFCPFPPKKCANFVNDISEKDSDLSAGQYQKNLSRQLTCA